MRILKAIFCVGGDTQINGVCYFDTHVHIIQWLTVKMILFLSQVLFLKKKQSDYTNMISKSPLKDGKEVYIALSHVFDIKREGEDAYRLNYSLYFMVQFPKR